MGKGKKKLAKGEKKARIKGDKGGNGPAEKPEPKPLTGVEVYSKPGLMQPLFAGLGRAMSREILFVRGC